MALGGGVFVTQNKVLPGSYINFVSAARANASLSDRGTATFGYIGNWGANGVVEVTNSDFQKNSLKIFGYSSTSEETLVIREAMQHAIKLYAYRLGENGKEATSTLGKAACQGTRGNDLRVVVEKSVDDPLKFIVSTYMGTVKVDVQTVANMDGLEDTAFVKWTRSATLTANAGIGFTGGANPTVTASDHEKYLAEIEGYTFNTIGLLTEDEALARLYVAYTKRMRDEVGAKFVAVVPNFEADYEGVINCVKSNAVPWVVGAEAGCLVNKSCTNMLYDGENDVDSKLSQSALEKAILAGKLVFHMVSGKVRLLTDINSLVTFSPEKNSDFASNQTVRVMDQIANDVAVIFNTYYLGKVQNNASGRTSLWSDIVKHHEALQTLGAIEDFEDKEIVVSIGDDKKSVAIEDGVKIVNAMEKLYMIVTVA